MIVIQENKVGTLAISTSLIACKGEGFQTKRKKQRVKMNTDFIWASCVRASKETTTH